MANSDSDGGVPAQRLAFGRRLRALRRRAGLTQTAAAAAAGMDRSFYAEVEAAVHSVSVDRIPALAKALGVEPYELFQNHGGG
ncbi:helix-turn-helix domain-containing protein [Streptomyces sp. NBC_00038]|uniref:helix-turn-helix domain-containing protein n=1 Tax=Streptomyces sp. NBC_00038 TaxID=2903615 RepID=UPI00224D14DD|nr:helix-turn-helix domain-containing protein [Streptomyces sp. NBC_00038]MCX5559514.1 helix-turn-helix domain-containing protein [Streptomyces sp. NBC_00038]